MKEIIGELVDVEITDRDVIALAIEDGFQVKWIHEGKVSSKKGPKVPAKEEEKPQPPVAARAKRTLAPRMSSESADSSADSADQETDAQQVPEVSAPEVADAQQAPEVSRPEVPAQEDTNVEGGTANTQHTANTQDVDALSEEQRRRIQRAHQAAQE